ISTVFLEFLKPGSLLLHSKPVYGGTDHFIHHILKGFGIHTVGFHPKKSEQEIIQLVEDTGHSDQLALVYIETPANPTNALFDLSMARRIADRFSRDDAPVYLAVDNTYMGPLWQHPMEHGADLVVYSATKYIAGHSDVIAGAVLGNHELMARIRGLRTFLGNMAGPWTGWLLMRSLETLKVRMDTQTRNAQKIAQFLNGHPKVEKVYYLGLLDESQPQQFAIYQEQCKAPGAMISFDIKGKEKDAFTFLNNLTIIKLAVSLGSTESLVEHPATMTHVDVSEEDRAMLGISEKLIRLSVGVENPDDIIWDISNSLDKV
ncbi:MAG TPA: methionine gamma-lyase, partial [Saprospiraceae bacterium]|nr:methionine gamma-lyase [Saprospiraceae bacterium]